MHFNRRTFQLASLSALALSCSGCIAAGDPGRLQGKVWGRRGISDGRLQKPRAIAIDNEDRLFIVDMTGRIQVFTPDGEFLYGWSMPKIDTGRPVGLSIHPDGNLMVADTHNFRVMFYTPAGEHLPDRTIGGTFGRAPGEFGLVTDVVVDSKGNYFISEYGDNDRIQKFSADHELIYQIGSHGNERNQFMRPQSMAIDVNDQLFVTDACNHRVKIFDVSGDDAELVQVFGSQGTQVGQMRYPYGLTLDHDGSIFICEFGNHRIQKFSPTGDPLNAFGVHGRREPGEFQQPWSLAFDSKHVLHILDSYNHRVQSIVV